MSRTVVTLRSAVVDDALFLTELWASSLRRVDVQEQVADLELIIKTAAESPEQRLVIAEHDGEPAGAVYLKVVTVSAVNLEPVLLAAVPHVVPKFRRRGVGRTLMDAATALAEELGISQVGTAVTSSSRDGNRFMARLGFGPHTVQRLAPTQALRTRIEAQRPVGQRHSGRNLAQVLAARRSLKKSRTP